MNTVLAILTVSGAVLLWRTYRYDEENAFNKKLDALPYLLRKPITCGLCFTFWLSLLAAIIFVPFAEWLPLLQYRFALGEAVSGLLNFLVSWLALGTATTFLVYVIDTFYQVSHYYKHAAHHS
jgi:hypothetical protein